MSGHTPGPWIVEAYPNLAAARADYMFEWAGGDDCFHGGPVGAVFQDCGKTGHTGLPGSIETSLPNARLIAAAPDLLEALRAVKVCRIAWPAAVEAQVNAAIAKAEASR